MHFSSIKDKTNACENTNILVVSINQTSVVFGSEEGIQRRENSISGKYMYMYTRQKLYVKNGFKNNFICPLFISEITVLVRNLLNTAFLVKSLKKE